MDYLLLKYAHILGAIVLLGTGAGIAFFMLMAHRSGDPDLIAGTARIVVIADWLFTTTAVIAQPITGFLLMLEVGASFADPWIGVSLALYVVAGVFWLPVVWIQIRMRDIAVLAASTGSELPSAYSRLFRVWFVFGFPGFGAVMAILWLMVAKPALW